MTISVSNEEYKGTYSVRNLGRDQGIHMPKGCSGAYAIYVDPTGTVVMVPMNKKERSVSNV